MALLASGLSIRGVQTVLTALTPGRSYMIRFPGRDPNFLTRVGYLWFESLAPNLSEYTQHPEDYPLWVKNTLLRCPSASATYRMRAAWTVSGYEYEVHDFF